MERDLEIIGNRRADYSAITLGGWDEDLFVHSKVTWNLVLNETAEWRILMDRVTVNDITATGSSTLIDSGSSIITGTRFY